MKEAKKAGEKSKLRGIARAKKALRAFVRSNSPFATAIADGAEGLVAAGAGDLLSELPSVGIRVPYSYELWKVVEGMRAEGADEGLLPLFDVPYPLLLILKNEELDMDLRLSAARVLVDLVEDVESPAGKHVVGELIECQAYILIQGLRAGASKTSGQEPVAEACTALLTALGESKLWSNYAMSVEQGRDAEDRAKRTCAKCRTLIQKGATKRCSRCKTTIYCSRECQVSHWKIHKAACKSKSAKKK